MKSNLLIGLFLFINISIFAQSDPNWKVLALVKFDERQKDPFNFGMPKAFFSNQVLSLHGKEITLDGFIYPLEGKKASAYFALSALPTASCYFCGGGGPETVVEIKASAPVDFTENRIKMKGTLLVSEFSTNGMLYTLEKATLVQ